MSRPVVAVTVAVLAAVIILAGFAVLVHVLFGTGQAGPSQQTCEFARWENQQLWPQGGGPPLPPGC